MNVYDLTHAANTCVPYLAGAVIAYGLWKGEPMRTVIKLFDRATEMSATPRANLETRTKESDGVRTQ